MINLAKMIGSILVIVLMFYMQGCTIKINCKEVDSINFHNGEETIEETPVSYKGAF
jgi:hypothetical protein